MQVEKLEVTVAPGFTENCYIASEGPAATRVVIIDPGAQAKRILNAVGDRAVDAIILTHRHFDHVGAAAALVKATGADVIAHKLDAANVSAPAERGSLAEKLFFKPIKVTRTVEEGDRIAVGEASLSVLHTPGHSIGSMCLYDAEGKVLLAGDTLFYGDVGRTDLPTGDVQQQRESLRRLATLPDDVTVYCGHDRDTTIGREKRYGHLGFFT